MTGTHQKLGDTNTWVTFLLPIKLIFTLFSSSKNGPPQLRSVYDSLTHPSTLMCFDLAIPSLQKSFQHGRHPSWPISQLCSQLSCVITDAYNCLFQISWRVRRQKKKKTTHRIAQKGSESSAVAQENIPKYKIGVVIRMVISQISSMSVAGWVPKKWMVAQNISNIVWNRECSPTSHERDIA